MACLISVPAYWGSYLRNASKIPYGFQQIILLRDWQ